MEARLRKVAQRLPFYAGLGLITAATLMLQIVETRIISVTSWYHLAFFVISIAMFGFTAGAAPGLSSSRDLPSRAIDLSSECRFAVRLRLGDRLCAPGATDHRHELGRLGHVVRRLDRVRRRPFAAILLLRIVVSLALTRSPYPVGIVYGADLLGAALGCLGALALLNLVSGPSAVLWIAVLGAAGACSSPELASRAFLPVDR